jgi:hypothetical protein
MFSALLVTTAAIAVGGGFLALLVGVQAGVDLFLGGIVVILPQGWLAYQLGSQRWSGKPAILAFAKYSLVGAGFAALFALKTPINGLAVLAGAVIAIGAVPIVFAAKERTKATKSGQVRLKQKKRR